MKTPAGHRRNPYRRLLHLLNQRYHREWLRAEALERELSRRRWLGPAFGWLRAIKRRLFGPGTADNDVATGSWQGMDEPPGPATGRVSVIIPFRDRLELLRVCVASLRRTEYRDFEVVLVNNGSREPATLRYLQRLRERGRARVVDRPGAFNFSWLCNEGARQTTGDYLLFLNNDTEVLTPDWLDRLVRLGSDPEVGAVGATLLYPDGTVQHAGAWPRGDGRWIHAHRGERPGAAWPPEAPGDARVVPAVTAACLMMRREVFDALGGFDERLAVAGNDVDLCQRATARGLRIVVSRHARLLHYEGLSRGRSLADDVALLGRLAVDRTRTGSRKGAKTAWHGSS